MFFLQRYTGLNIFPHVYLLPSQCSELFQRVNY